MQGLYGLLKFGRIMCGERTCFCCSCFYYGDLIAEQMSLLFCCYLDCYVRSKLLTPLSFLPFFCCRLAFDADWINSSEECKIPFFVNSTLHLKKCMVVLEVTICMIMCMYYLLQMIGFSDSQHSKPKTTNKDLSLFKAFVCGTNSRTTSDMSSTCPL